MNNLIRDVIIVIFNKLDIIHLIGCIRVCRYFNNISNEDIIWRNRFSKRYLKKNRVKNFKQQYIKYYCYRNNSDKLGILPNKQNTLSQLSIRHDITPIPNTICIFTNLLSLDICNNF